jgi:hypothetical protein
VAVLAVAVVVAMWRGGRVVELAVAMVVKIVVEVDVAVAGGVPFGHPCPPQMFTIILITLSD